MLISPSIMADLNRAPKAVREHVDGIVRRHISACRNLGVTPDSLDRVIIEAIEDYNQENAESPFTLSQMEHTSDSIKQPPAWRYQTYVAPKPL